jgi:phospholipid transport system substrate-binding protein
MTIKRRTFIAAALATSLMPVRAFALTTGQARNLVDRIVGDINSVIGSGASETAMIRQFEQIFADYADVPIIARSALGNPWRSASDAQRRAYVGAFQSYMAKKYGRRFREFIGGRIEITDAKTVPNGIEVHANALLQGQAPYNVSFVISDGSGAPKFINMFIEGISMILSERTEIGAMLDRRRGDINGLIADLEAF